MQIQETTIKGVFRIMLEPKGDERGYFMRTYCRDELAEKNLQFPIVQASRSFTKQKGAIRGLHFHRSPKQEGKIVQCIQGRIFDVVVDIRPNSPTFKKWIGMELTEVNNETLLIPQGCAHGFQTLEENCMVEYFMSDTHDPQYAGGLPWNDPAFNIKWPLEATQLSEKDKGWLPISERKDINMI